MKNNFEKKINSAFFIYVYSLDFLHMRYTWYNRTTRRFCAKEMQHISLNRPASSKRLY